MLPITEIDAVYDAVWRNDLTLIKQTKSKYGSQLYLRFLANTGEFAPKVNIQVISNNLVDDSFYNYTFGMPHLIFEKQLTILSE